MAETKEAEMSERDRILEEAACYIEEVNFLDLRGVMAKRKRDREDAQLRLQAREELRTEMARDIRRLKTRRGSDAVEVLRDLADLPASGRHDAIIARLTAAEAARDEAIARVKRLEKALRRATDELEEIVSFTRTERCCLHEQEIASIAEVAEASRAALAQPAPAEET